MLLKNNLSTGIQIIKCRLFSIKKPLFIGWNITEQCNYQCPFCNLWKKSNKAQELSTEEIKQGITYLKNEGTLAIAFGEGEPLLRNDIGEITKFCKKNRIITKINTNGSLVPEKINEIKNVNLIKMTLNGPRKIHDQERIPGAFDKVLTALETLKKNNINVGLNFVINKNNYQHINEMIYLAKNFNTKITFQPLEQRFGHNEYVENNFLSPAAHKDVFFKFNKYKKNY